MADPYLKRYHRERAKRVRAILADEANLVRGGQGRTAGDLHRDASGIVFAIVLLLLLAIALIVGGSS